MNRLSQAHSSKLMRFIISGGLATLCYIIGSFFMATFTEFSALTIHIGNYWGFLPVSYFLQRNFTFRHQGDQKQAVIRFITATILTFALSTIAVQLLAQAGYPILIGTIITVIIAPLVSYLVMHFWVFKA